MEGLIIGGVVFAVFIFVGYCVVQFRVGYWEAKQQAERAMVAARVAAGEKPWGAPFAGSMYGDSYFISTEQLLAKRLAMPLEKFPAACPHLGIHGDGAKKPECRVIYSRDGHILTVAPTRRGKGVSHVIPNLITYDGSVFVIDIKGENFAITGSYRAIDNNVFAFQPFDEDGDTAHFNPIHFIRQGPDAFEDAQLIAELIVPPTGHRGDDFWDTACRELVAGIILHVATSGPVEQRTLAKVRHILTMSEPDFLEILGDMNLSSNRFVTRSADTYLNMDGKVRANVRTTANSKTGFLDSERLEAAMSYSDFRFEDLKKDRTAIYIIIPPERLSTHKTLLRLMSGLAIAAMTRETTVPEIPVLFVLDEFLQLHRMERILDGLRYLAGYGVRFWLFVQDLPSLRNIYGNDAALAIIANCNCRIFFGVSDNDTARLVSDMTGNMTILVENKSVSSNSKNSFEQNISTSYTVTGRRLLGADEILALPDRAQLIFISGIKPILAGRTPYYELPIWKDVEADIAQSQKPIPAPQSSDYVSPYKQLKDR